MKLGQGQRAALLSVEWETLNLRGHCKGEKSRSPPGREMVVFRGVHRHRTQLTITAKAAEDSRVQTTHCPKKTREHPSSCWEGGPRRPLNPLLAGVQVGLEWSPFWCWDWNSCPFLNTWKCLEVLKAVLFIWLLLSRRSNVPEVFCLSS